MIGEGRRGAEPVVGARRRPSRAPRGASSAGSALLAPWRRSSSRRRGSGAAPGQRVAARRGSGTRRASSCARPTSKKGMFAMRSTRRSRTGRRITRWPRRIGSSSAGREARVDLRAVVVAERLAQRALHRRAGAPALDVEPGEPDPGERHEAERGAPLQAHDRAGIEEARCRRRLPEEVMRRELAREPRGEERGPLHQPEAVRRAERVEREQRPGERERRRTPRTRAHPKAARRFSRVDQPDQPSGARRR